MSFAFGYLLDEHLSPVIARYLRLGCPDLRVYFIGDGIAPPKATSDPAILAWCESNGCVLITDDRSTMPGHLADHLRAGGHVPGVFLVPDNMTVAELGDHLSFVAQVALAGEFSDMIRFLPIP